MSSPFKNMATQQKENKVGAAMATTPTFIPPSAAMQKEIGKPKYSPEDIKTWMDASKATKKSKICALFVGQPKIGKSGVLLDIRSEQEIADGMKIVIFEMNSDQGCDLNKSQFHPNDNNIIILNPWVRHVGADGKWQVDYISTMEKIKSAIQYIKENNDPKLKALGVDGLDIFLSEICESQMRLDENLDAAGGVSMRFWKNRNKMYYDVLNMLLDIDVDKYFITHYSERSRDKDTNMYNDKRTVSKIASEFVYGCQKDTTSKMHQVVEFTDKTTVVNGKKNIKIIATIVADRRSLDHYMDETIIAETGSDGKIVWNGRSLLERKDVI